MAYEYEKTIKEELEFTDLDNTDNQDEMLKELKEVYRKAKDWDNYIAEVRERVKITVNTDDDVERETQKVIDYFMEEEQYV